MRDVICPNVSVGPHLTQIQFIRNAAGFSRNVFFSFLFLPVIRETADAALPMRQTFKNYRTSSHKASSC